MQELTRIKIRDPSSHENYNKIKEMENTGQNLQELKKDLINTQSRK